MKEVVIVQYRLAHYRIRFYEHLRGYLRSAGVRLRILYSDPEDELDRGQLVKRLFANLPWGEIVPSKVLPGNFTWQPFLSCVLQADLVIVSHANKHILNYGYLLLPFVSKPKLAFWGHGWGHQAVDVNSRSERIKRWLGRRAHWYFAYTWKVRQELIELGFSPDRITDVQNAVAQPDLQVEPEEIARVKEELNLSAESRVALYCGRMYAMKQLDMLVDAAERVHEKLPSFALILAGAGTDERIAEDAARTHDFIHFVGPVLGMRKAALFSVSRVVVMPGLVGLGIVDAFHFCVPPIATTFPHHSPEFVYLEDGENGLVTENSAEELARGMERLLTDDALQAKLARGAKEASDRHTVEEMAQRFANGILAALDVKDTIET
jgi:glycosyltransferase involved in cell wall biosynthesis